MVPRNKNNIFLDMVWSYELDNRLTNYGAGASLNIRGLVGFQQIHYVVDFFSTMQIYWPK